MKRENSGHEERIPGNAEPQLGNAFWETIRQNRGRKMKRENSGHEERIPGNAEPQLGNAFREAIRTGGGR
jgi:hypothetical protein